MTSHHRALHALATAAAEELRDLRDPDPLARHANHAASLTMATIERYWLPELATPSAGDDEQ